MQNHTKSKDKHTEQPQTKNLPWWNRPLFGDKSLLQKIKQRFWREEMPERAVLVYSNTWLEADKLASLAGKIDSVIFTSEEFKNFFRIKYYLAKGLGEYRNLNTSFQLLKGAVEAKNCFLKIEQIELRYRSIAQQEFYQFVYELLEANIDKSKLKTELQPKLIEILPQIKSSEGKQALRVYSQQLYLLAQEHEFGLHLLALFKQYDLDDYSILKRVSDVVESVREVNLSNVQMLTPLVIENIDTFQRLGQIIQIPIEANHPETYAQLLQVIGLDYRHSLAYEQFQQLLSYLREWLMPFRSLKSLLNSYPASTYRHPAEFRKPIPGFELYQRYQKPLEQYIDTHA